MHKTPEINYTALAGERLIETGFLSLSLEEMDRPIDRFAEANDGTKVRYRVYGDLDASAIVLTTPNYTVTLDHESHEVKMNAYQTVLGNNYCLVSAELFHPKSQPFNHKQRKDIAHGSFRPFAERFLSVAKAVKRHEGQNIVLANYSLGADVGFEYEFQYLFNSNWDSPEIHVVSGVEAARVENRSRIQADAGRRMINLFDRSGKNLFSNIVLSDSDALIAAHGIDFAQTNPGKKFMSKTKQDVIVNYWLKNPLSNWAITQGFGSDKTKQQLNAISSMPADQRPLTIVGRLRDSLINTEEFYKSLAGSDLVLFQELGDHSSGDHLQLGAGFILRAVAAKP